MLKVFWGSQVWNWNIGVKQLKKFELNFTQSAVFCDTNFSYVYYKMRKLFKMKKVSTKKQLLFHLIWFPQNITVSNKLNNNDNA